MLTAYFYQMPPSFDDQLTKNVLANVRWAAVFYLFFGFWMLSNQVIFQNFWSVINDTSDVMLSGHTLDKVLVDQSSPMLLIGIAVLIIIWLQMIFKKQLKVWGYSFGGAKMNVDENLPFFFTSIKLSDADWLCKENLNLKENYGFSIIPRRVHQILDTTSPPKKAISGIPYYMLLANPLYFREFQYVCCDVPDRNLLIRDDDDDDDNDCEQSDIVSILLNMAFIPEQVIEEFHFETGFHETFKPAMDAFLHTRGKALHGRGSKDNSKISSKSGGGGWQSGVNKLFTTLKKSIINE